MEKVRKIRPIMFNASWTCRPSGGIFLGFRLHFPVTCIFQDDTCRSFFNISIGLVFVQLGIDFVGKPKAEGMGL